MFSWHAISVFGFTLPTSVVLFVITWLSWERIVILLKLQHALKSIRPEILLLVGLLISRISYVLIHFNYYQESLWDVINIRDGGFYFYVGLVVIGIFAICRHQGAARYISMSLILLLALMMTGLNIAKQQAFTLPKFNEIYLNLLTQNQPSTEIAPLQNWLDQARINDQAVIINVWASWCPPCRREMPALEHIQKTRSDVLILFVNQQESAEQITAFLNIQQLDLKNILIDSHGDIMKNANLLALPSTLFIDKKGNWQGTHTGEITASALNATIDQLINPSSK